MPSENNSTKKPTKMRDRLLIDSPLLESSVSTREEDWEDIERDEFSMPHISAPKNMPQRENLGFNRNLEENLVPHGQENVELRGSDEFRTQEEDVRQFDRFAQLGRPKFEKSLKVGDDSADNK
ncbi:MAG: hypothetical protein ACE5OZ_10920 [Candidatus Heimdallarchaeota archaeon]